MLEFLVIWFWCLAALAVAVGGLSLTYYLSDTDFGTSGIWRETIIVVIVSAAQAAAVLGVYALVGEGSRWTGRTNAVILAGLLYFTYKLTHLQEMEDQEIGILITADLGILLLVSLYSTL